MHVETSHGPSMGRDAEVGRIDVSIIAPARYLRDFVSQVPPTVHHVAAQRVLNDQAYRDFFVEEARGGAAVILDNGVFDLGVALPAPDLVRAARAVRAAEIILPDVMRDGSATITASDRAANEIQALAGDEFRLCAVVHGTDDDDWSRCYEHFASCGYASAIALPASRGTQVAPTLCRDRTAATRYLADNGLIEPRLTYRLLGLGRTGHLELFEQRRHRWISSVDGAAPVLLGALGIKLLPSGPYDKVHTPRIDKVREIQPSRFALIRDNIAVVRAAANSPVTIRAQS